MLLAIAGALLLAKELIFRLLESHLQAWLLDTTIASAVDVGTIPGRPSFMFTAPGEKGWFCIEITPECSIAFYLVPIIFATALLALAPRIPLARLLAVLGLSLALIVVLNQVRLWFISYAFQAHGHSAYEFVHGPAGSALMICGLVGVLTMFLRLLIRRPRRRTAVPVQ